MNSIDYNNSLKYHLSDFVNSLHRAINSKVLGNISTQFDQLWLIKYKIHTMQLEETEDE